MRLFLSPHRTNRTSSHIPSGDYTRPPLLQLARLRLLALLLPRIVPAARRRGPAVWRRSPVEQWCDATTWPHGATPQRGSTTWRRGEALEHDSVETARSKAQRQSSKARPERGGTTLQRGGRRSPKCGGARRVALRPWLCVEDEQRKVCDHDERDPTVIFW